MANPTLQELINRDNADLTNQFDGVDPTLSQSFAGVFPEMVAGRAYEIYGSLALVVSRLLLLTTENDFLDAWASIFKLTRNTATAATGRMAVTGAVGTAVPLGTAFNSESGLVYEVQPEDPSAPVNPVIAAYSDTAASFNVSGTSVTVTTSSPHGLASGQTVNIGAANLPAEIIGNYQIVVTADDEFNYTSATAAINGVYPNGAVSANFVNVPVLAQSFGSNTNQGAGAELTLAAPIAGVDNTAYAALGGFTGGADVESDGDFRKRLLFRIRNPPGDSSPNYYKNLLLSFGGITRVWVRQLFPIDPGSLTIYYVRDGENPIFPSAQDITEVSSKVPAPATIPEANRVIEAPTEKSIEFTFGDIQPDTPSMRAAVTAALEQFFRDSVTMGFEQGTITVNQYTRPIQSAIDLETGEGISDFALTSVDGVTPAADIAIAGNELPTLGTITYT